jgi:multicomponent K+:H+ antiporter subunit E
VIRTFARRISPVLVLGLAVLWLVLNQSFALGQVVLGVLLGVLLAWAGSTLRPLHARVRRLDIALLLVGIVFYDIVRSNLHVAQVVLGLTGKRVVRSDFLDIPLDLRDPHGLAALAVIVTATPGTVCAGFTPDGNWMRLHVIDLQDEAALTRLIKERYERRLMRIFQ